MMSPVPLEPGRLNGLAWTFPAHFGFARDRLTVPLVASELLRAAHDFAIVFVRSSNDWQAAAYLGDEHGRPGRFVDAEGRWRAGYIPFWLRVYPFAITDGQVGVVLDPGLVGVAGTHPFSSGEVLSREAIAVAKRLTGVSLATVQSQDAIRRLVDCAGLDAPFGRAEDGIVTLDAERFRRSVRENLTEWSRHRQALEFGIAAQFSGVNAPRAVLPVTLDDTQPPRHPTVDSARPLLPGLGRVEVSTVPADLDWLDTGEKIDLERHTRS